MSEQIQRFMATLDTTLAEHAGEGEHLDLYHIGRSALVLHYGLQVSTKDFDIVWLGSSKLEEKAIELFGKESANAKALGLYLDPVPQGLPPLPHGFRKRCRAVPGEWKVLRLWSLEPHDYAKRLYQ